MIVPLLTGGISKFHLYTQKPKKVHGFHYILSQGVIVNYSISYIYT